ncbi:hypothetical protein K1T71_005763 [Dendrolimus kikuchii]|uniref:Uncharacterized protein n=1 Tax=Dendrolimus kikuchii TaxID=765133 RepID=A0ACC1D4X9_9NEOP|nr:hypothetical protein K1T71_005763 [Dendrolimus kikuchii]
MHKGILLFLTAVCGLGNGATTKKKLVTDDPKIYFPEELSNRFNEDNIPDECKGKNYCTVKPAFYDDKKYNKFFNNSKNLDGPQLIVKPILTIDDKIGDDAGDDCDVEVIFKPLYGIRTKRGDWHTVIQAPENNYVQKVRIENCRNENAPCFQGIGYPSEIETGCKQKFSVWEFYVDDGEGGMKKEVSELPICCSCHYRVNFANRIGGGK